MSNGKKPAKAGDESYAVLQSLIAKGRKEGMLRASELNAELEKLDISPEKIEEIYEKYGEALVNDTIKKIYRAQFKRKQSTLGIRLTERSFGSGVCYPIVHKFV